MRVQNYVCLHYQRLVSRKIDAIHFRSISKDLGKEGMPLGVRYILCTFITFACARARVCVCVCVCVCVLRLQVTGVMFVLEIITIVGASLRIHRVDSLFIRTHARAYIHTNPRSIKT